MTDRIVVTRVSVNVGALISIILAIAIGIGIVVLMVNGDASQGEALQRGVIP